MFHRIGSPSARGCRVVVSTIPRFDSADGLVFVLPRRGPGLVPTGASWEKEHGPFPDPIAAGVLSVVWRGDTAVVTSRPGLFAEDGFHYTQPAPITCAGD